MDSSYISCFFTLSWKTRLSVSCTAGLLMTNSVLCTWECLNFSFTYEGQFLMNIKCLVDNPSLLAFWIFQTTDFWPRELRENYVCCLSQPACGICYGSPRKLRQRCSSVTPREPQEGTRDGVFSDHACTLTTYSPGKVSFPSHTGPSPHADHMSVWCAPRVSEISRLTTYSPSQFWTSPLFHVWF